MAEVERTHFDLQTLNPISPEEEVRCCYLNDLGKEWVHQRQGDAVYSLPACFALWNIFNLF